MALCALALQKQIAPPTINIENQDPECDLDYVSDGAREMPIDAILNNSFGFGGHNATIAARRFV
jgi:3-oxoacyl-[acyl-carrier-protein] synthase II